MNVHASAAAFEHDLGNGLTALNCTLDGVHCGGCTNKIERHLNALDGVTIARANATTKRLRLVWDPSITGAETLISIIEGLGFKAYPYVDEDSKSRENSLLIPLAVAGFGTMNVMAFSFAVWAGLVTDMGPNTRDFMHWISGIIALPVIIYSSSPFYIPAFVTLRAGRMTMDTPITLAIFGTLAASVYETLNGAEHVYFDAAVSLVFFLLIGRVLDQMLRRRSSNASDNLRAIGQSHAQRLTEDGRTETILADALHVGDRILVPTGEQVAADGILRSSVTTIDESILSGETLPRAISPGEVIVAGSIVTGDAATIEVIAIGADARLSIIAGLVENAESHKGKEQLLADKFARGYGPIVMAGAVIGFLLWYFALGAGFSEALLISVAVLIVTCPCAAGLATPAVIVRAVNQLLEQGVIIKSGDALERLASVDVALLDKTGTLTNAMLVLDQMPDQAILSKASALAANSSHPLSKALIRACPAVPLAGVREQVGQGLISPDGARLGSAMFVGVEVDQLDDGPELWYKEPDSDAVRFSFQDMEKPDAAALAQGLKRLKLKPIILSGDTNSIVKLVAKRLGIAEWHAALQPEKKFLFIENMKQQGFKPLMIGDGLNDAPSLAAAHVSISPVSASQISQSAADIVLVREGLLRVVTALKTARSARRLISQNLIFATAYNVVTVPIALMGGLTPLIAAILMSSSSVLVMLNALRLKSET